MGTKEHLPRGGGWGRRSVCPWYSWKGTGAMNQRGDLHGNSLELSPGGWERLIAECGVRGLSVPKDLLQKGCALAFLGTAEAEGHTPPTPSLRALIFKGSSAREPGCAFLLRPLPSTERVHSTTVTNLVNRQEAHLHLAKGIKYNK